MILLVGLLAPQAGRPRVAQVTADVADVLDEPDDGAFSTERMAKGRQVTVRREGPDGWLTISPPDGAFSLVEENALEDLGDGRARIIFRLASVRPGREGARIPGPPHVTLKQGAIVRLLDRRPLVVRQDGTSRTWIAIAPPASEVRFLRADAASVGPIGMEEEGPVHRDRLVSGRLEVDSRPGDSMSSGTVSPLRIGPIDADFTSAESGEPQTGISREVLEELSRIAARHRSELRQPIDRWNLGPIEDAYSKLLRGGLDAAERAVVEGRIARVRRQRTAAQGAAKLDSLLKASRERDHQIAQSRRNATSGEGDKSRAFDAAGLLQTSSRSVEGRRVLALLGDDGTVVAYLMIPPGLTVEPFLSHRVGVRGEGHYEETLRARLILVRDLERLERHKSDGGRIDKQSAEPR